MATIKSYTDLQQSKRLAEILPTESADMHYKVNRYNNESKIFMIPYSKLGYYKNNYYQYSVCAWSLAALLSVLPHGTRLLKSATDDTYHCDCPKGNVDKWFDNHVDACVSMILDLHKNNML